MLLLARILLTLYQRHTPFLFARDSYIVPSLPFLRWPQHSFAGYGGDLRFAYLAVVCFTQPLSADALRAAAGLRALTADRFGALRLRTPPCCFFAADFTAILYHRHTLFLLGRDSYGKPSLPNFCSPQHSLAGNAGDLRRKYFAVVCSTQPNRFFESALLFFAKAALGVPGALADGCLTLYQRQMPRLSSRDS